MGIQPNTLFRRFFIIPTKTIFYFGSFTGFGVISKPKNVFVLTETRIKQKQKSKKQKPYCLNCPYQCSPLNNMYPGWNTARNFTNCAIPCLIVSITKFLIVIGAD